MPRLRLPGSSLGLATTAYVLVTVAMTWPLVLGLTRDLPADLGDSLLNCYILAWDASRLARALAGEWRALDGFWSAGIFHPEPLALAYSDHLLAQAVQILPVYALTGNPLLCYNLLFLATFVLSGLGTYLLVRDLGAPPGAAFVAGLCYGFAPYRVAQFAHLQILSSQWMPFVLYGLRRYVATRRRRALAGASLALVAHHLSSGYLMLFFAPFVAAYVGFELLGRRLYRERRVVLDLGVAAAAVIAATVPCLIPYWRLRALGMPPRQLEEVQFYAADLLSYVTAAPWVRWWGPRLQALPKPEGELFPGIVPVVLALVGVAAHARHLWRRTTPEAAPSHLSRALALLALLVGLGYLGAFGVALFTDRVQIGPLVTLSLRGKGRLLLLAAGAFAALLLVSPRARRVARGEPGSAVAFYLAALAAAVLLSFGPVITVAGKARLQPGPYYFLYQVVPGFDGLRVPARFGMLAALFLAVLAGLGAATLARRGRRGGTLLVLASGGLFLLEATAAPIPRNLTVAEIEGGHLNPPPPRVYPAAEAPAVYHFLRTLPVDAVIVELPFGIDAYDLRAVYYATVHGRRLVNGYSGYFPPPYEERQRALRAPLDDPPRACRVLLATGATHLLLHGAAYRPDEAGRITQWLRGCGATAVAQFGDDRLFRLPGTRAGSARQGAQARGGLVSRYDGRRCARPGDDGSLQRGSGSSLPPPARPATGRCGTSPASISSGRSSTATAGRCGSCCCSRQRDPPASLPPGGPSRSFSRHIPSSTCGCTPSGSTWSSATPARCGPGTC